MAIDLTPYYQLWISGKRIPSDMLKYVSEIEVEDTGNNGGDLSKSSLAKINILDKDLVWMNDAGIIKGNRVEIYMGTWNIYRKVFSGNISKLDGSYPTDGTKILVISAIADDKYQPSVYSSPVTLTRREGGSTDIISFTPTVREKEEEQKE